MDRFKIKEQMRKIKWATEHETGKKMGKKGLIEVQSVVMAMVGAEKLEVKPDLNWRGKPKVDAKKMEVDLSKLIGRKF